MKARFYREQVTQSLVMVKGNTITVKTPAWVTLVPSLLLVVAIKMANYLKIPENSSTGSGQVSVSRSGKTLYVNGRPVCVMFSLGTTDQVQVKASQLQTLMTAAQKGGDLGFYPTQPMMTLGRLLFFRRASDLSEDWFR